MILTAKSLFRTLKLVALLCCSVLGLSAQQSLTKVNGMNAYVFLPADYNTSTKKYPVIIFIPGLGEIGTDASKLLVNGPSKFIASGWDGKVTVNGVTETPIIMSIQPPQAWPQPDYLNTTFDSIVKRWRIDEARFYLTGLSMGAFAHNNYITHSVAYSKRLTAIVSMSSPPSNYDLTNYRWYATAGGKWWGFEGTQDDRGMWKIRDQLNAAVAGSARYTSYNGGHCCWNTFYDPKWTENGETIYQWMLKQKKAGAIVENQPPAANAGTDITINLPTNSVTLKGSGYDSDGDIKSYSWKKISGPATFSIVSPLVAQTVINNLVSGVYEFELTVTDNSGATATDVVKVTVAGSANIVPKSNAGGFQTLYVPFTTITLKGGGSDIDGTIKGYTWRKIDGPAGGAVTTPNAATTQVTGLVEGVYRFELLVTDNNDGTAKDTATVKVYATANNYVGSGSKQNMLGVNPGYYGSNWSDIQLYDLMNNAGGKSTRATIPMYFFRQYSDNVRLKESEYLYNTLGFRENVFFLNNHYGDSYPDKGTETFDGLQTRLPKGLYEPIWNANGTVNENNTFARYCMKVATVYGKYYKYFEVWNEPDFSYNWAVAEALPGAAGNWWDNDPAPKDLENCRAPIQYYIRMLRIAYEVIKKYKSDALICTGGLGYASYIDALLRNTDNPNVDGAGKRGAVSNDFPLKAGAYFDCFSWHIYPHFYVGYWDGSPGGGMKYRRHSDEMITQTDKRFDGFLKVFKKHGYDGFTYPAKPSILTELNIPRKTVGTEWGGIEAQRNYAIKALVDAAKLDVNQTYWYQTGELQDYATTTYSFDVMGMYENLKRDKPGQAKMTDLGKANKTFRMLLGDYVYDKTATAQMAIPNGIGGGAYKNATTGEMRFVVWAKTTADLSEVATGYYSFPTSLASKKLNVYKWDYCETNKAIDTVNPTGIPLTGEPYIFTLTTLAPDNQQGTNDGPTVDAGANRRINNLDWVQLTGTATHPQNLKMTYFWQLVDFKAVAGAKVPTISGQNTLSAKALELKKGYYIFSFTATDEKGKSASDTVTISVDTTVGTINNPPVANAGKDQTITLPANSVQITGAASTDADGKIVSYKWTKAVGPAAFTIATPNEMATSVTGLVEGVYEFELLVTDNSNNSHVDRVKITVNPAPAVPNKAPVANAGNAQSITLPANSVQLSGAASTDADGKISSYKWAKVSGPTTFTIATPNAVTTSVTGLVEGVYEFELTVTDDKNATSAARVKVTVNAAPVIPNKAPVANAGNDQAITLPANSVQLSGASSTDEDGKINGYKWAKVSGPTTFTIATPNAVTTSVTGLVEGVYEFELTVTDDKNATSTARAKVTVNAAPVIPNKAPVANAGNAQTITLPINSVQLSGAASTDADGKISSYKWAKLNGPTTFTIATPNAVTTDVTGLVEGVYEFELTVTDDKTATATARVKVTVNAAPILPNQAPVANAGPDAEYTLPSSSISLNGSASNDPDGSITAYSWTKISGPSPLTVLNSNTATPGLTNIVEGTYIFELVVTDNRGATASDRVTIIINPAPPVRPANRRPVSRANAKDSVTLPTNSVTLNGSQSYDPDGSIATYKWTQKSGPQAATMVTTNAAMSMAANLVEGTYVFDLTVTDNTGESNTSSVQVKVYPDNRAPALKLTIGPNPASSMLNYWFQSGDKERVVMNIYNIKGNKLITRTIDKTSAITSGTINVAGLAGGLYYFEIRRSNGRSVTKMFLKK